ncbi:glycine oxidase ThiO [Gorillibacterium sp. sgz5001074]|uniref:glycine oxidase ThiO n=1 Tax=Gorillibacterium sp. sgz5001074 TaxID=3446695 RepID=UPI003F680B90
MNAAHKQADVIIIGAGIIGSSIAYHMSKKGISCLVLERGAAAQEATAASAGMLGAMMETDAPGPLVELAVASQARYRKLAETLFEDSGVDIEYTECGTVGVARDEAEKAALLQKCSFARDFGQRVDWIETGRLLELEPGLSPDLLGGVHIPGDHQVQSPKVALAFRTAAIRLGARFLEHTPVLRLLTEGRRVAGVETTDGSFYADHVVLAGGSWSPGLLTGLGIDLPVYPVKGQCYSAILPEGLKHTVFALKCYLMPKRDGTILVGATQEEAGFDKSPTAQGIAYLHEIAASMVPAMKKAVFVRTWTGLRPGNPQLKPFLGPVEGREGLLLATGHFRKGTLLAPITGEMLTSMVTGEALPLDPSPFTLRGHGLQ